MRPDFSGRRRLEARRSALGARVALAMCVGATHSCVRMFGRRRLLLLLLAVLIGWSSMGGESACAEPAATAWRASPRDGGVRFTLDLSDAVSYSWFFLHNPDRVVIDMSELVWRIPSRPALQLGLIGGARFGLLRPGVSRVVLDLVQPAKVSSAQLVKAPDGHGHRLVVDLSALTPTPGASPPTAPAAASTASAGGGAGVAPKTGTAPRVVAALPPRTANAPQAATAADPQKPSKPRDSRPMIVIDPGHGGIDPGAISASGIYEKNIVLSLGKELRRQLEATKRYRVAMTRDTDVFVRLRDRVAIARRKDADLFISLHADSLGDKSVSGLSVYTQSEVASDREAEALAARENKADVIAGMDLSEEKKDVADILIDISQRGVKNDSVRFAGGVVKELSKETSLLNTPHRFAGFAVLTAPDIPAVLLESGYLSNAKDEKRLREESHQRKLAQALVRSIDAYFGRGR